MIAPTEIIIKRVHIQKISCDDCKGRSYTIPGKTKKQALDIWRDDGWVINGYYCKCPSCAKKGCK